jgi:ABC-type branched-subunit amino acid transport system substrate-binding protein
MTRFTKRVLVCFSILGVLFLSLGNPATSFATESKGVLGEVKSAFNADKMGDMKGYDPSNPVIPTGDTIKIAVVASFSGPAAANGHFYFNIVQWVAHDINKRGGIMVDGKKKLIQVIKADHMSKPATAKSVVERMILQEKVDFLWGTDGSHLMRVINEAADRYKVIALNATCLSDNLQDATNFSRYTFHTAYSTEQVGRAFAYFYGQMRKKEKRFYILNQDYSFGHELAAGFKKGLQEYYPEAQLVGEDFHKLFLTDYAPYLEKVRASNAEVIFTGDWLPDAGNLLKQARQMNMNIPFANIYMDEPNFLLDVGVEGTKGLMNLSAFNSANPQFQLPGHKKFYATWNNLWKTTWKTPPYNSRTFEIYGGNWGNWTMVTYWLFDIVERAGTLNPEKLIELWEGDTYRYVNGKVVHMRADDHKIVQDLTITEWVPPDQQNVSMNIYPFYWYQGSSSYGPSWVVPAEKCIPWIDPKLVGRSKKK